MSTRRERLGGTEGNEILTSTTAVVLTLLLVAEGVTILLNREKGAPPLPLRALAPLLVVATVTVFASGVVMLVSGRRTDLVFNLHKVGFIVWGGCFAVHFLAHLPDTVRSLQRGWARSGRRRVAGSELRLGLVIASMGGGLALALAVLSLITGWRTFAEP
jgi:hypothetical protein